MEYQFHQWIKNQSPLNHPGIVVGVGDDAAVLEGSVHHEVLATDTIAQGTHFVLDDLSDTALRQIGHKLAAVNLSDLAAMGATPVAMTLNFQVPRSFYLDHLKHLFLGAAEIASRYDVAIVGGDTNSWDGPLVLSATVTGRRDANLQGWLLRNAQLGDAVLVSGQFGGSIHGRHLRFEPRIPLANYLADHYDVHAATDVSDSLSLDLMAIARASQVAVAIETQLIPLSQDIDHGIEPSVLAGDPDILFQKRLEHALSDGEDFELVLTMPIQEAARVVADPGLPTPLVSIGMIQEGEPALLDSNGESIPVSGYVHS